MASAKTTVIDRFPCQYWNAFNMMRTPSLFSFLQTSSTTLWNALDVCCLVWWIYMLTSSMLSLGNSACRLKPKHKQLLYRLCVMLITLYSICLWYYDGVHLKGTMKELTKIQRQAAVWILGAFKSTPTGAVESLAGLIPIHLQIWKLVYCNHIHVHMLADSHITCLMAATRNKADFISVYHPSWLRNKCKSLLMDIWTNENLVDMFVLPYNKYNAPGYCLTDTCPECIIQDIFLIQGKTAKDRAKVREAHLMTLN